MTQVNWDSDIGAMSGDGCFMREKEQPQKTMWNGRAVCFRKEESNNSNASQSIDYSIYAETDRGGDSRAGGTIDYNISTETESGTSFSGSVGGYGEVDNHGGASGGVEVGGSVRW
jgi:hypothetical protein